MNIKATRRRMISCFAQIINDYVLGNNRNRAESHPPKVNVASVIMLPIPILPIANFSYSLPSPIGQYP